MLKRSIGGENFYIPLPQIIFFITYHNEVSAIFLKLWCLIYFSKPNFSFSSGQSLSRAWLSANPWVTARQASLSITNSQSSLKLTSIESVMPSSHLILCRPLLLLPPIPPSIRVFPMSQLFAWGGQSTGVSASASFLPKNTQDWSPLEWTD